MVLAYTAMGSIMFVRLEGDEDDVRDETSVAASKPYPREEVKTAEIRSRLVYVFLNYIYFVSIINSHINFCYIISGGSYTFPKYYTFELLFVYIVGWDYSIIQWLGWK